MTVKQLASKLTKAEGKKISVRQSDVEELLKILAGLMAEDPSYQAGGLSEVEVTLDEYATKILKKRKKK